MTALGDPPVDQQRVADDVDCPLSIEVHTSGASATLVLEGCLDISTSATFVAVADQIDPGFSTISVDLSAVTFIDSTGVGLLVKTKRNLASNFRTMWLINPSERARFVLELTGLGELIA